MLKTELSCEVGDLIDEVVAKSGKTYAEVEKAFFQCGIYPQSRKTFLTQQFGPILVSKREQYPWLEETFTNIFTEGNFKSIYVTEAI